MTIGTTMTSTTSTATAAAIARARFAASRVWRPPGLTVLAEVAGHVDPDLDDHPDDGDREADDDDPRPQRHQPGRGDASRSATARMSRTPKPGPLAVDHPGAGDVEVAPREAVGELAQELAA